MQDLVPQREDDHRCFLVNKYCADLAAAAAAAGVGSDGATGSGAGGASSSAARSGGAAGAGGRTEGVDSQNLMDLMQGLTAASPPGGASGSEAGAGAVPSGQADALASIMENLTGGGTLTADASSDGAGALSSSPGAAVAPAATPVPSSGTSSAPGAPARSSDAAGGTSVPASAPAGGLTLADLQGAMAGLATSTPPGTAAASPVPVGPPLSELASPPSVEASGILDDPAVRSRLLELLPEGQRTSAMLEENLRSPQVRQCLASLTAALAEGDDFNSILANFRLDPADGASALEAGNPIQAFLDCILRQVEREREEGASGTEEEKGGESKMEE